MPLYDLADPSHPLNQQREIHRAALAIVGPGGMVPTKVWTVWVKLRTGVLNRQNAHQHTQNMEDHGMVRLHHGKSVEVRPLEDVILPGGWQEPSGTLEPTAPIVVAEAPFPLAWVTPGQ